MSSMERRNAAFLDEMGISPLWQLRNAPELQPELEAQAQPQPQPLSPASPQVADNRAWAEPLSEPDFEPVLRSVSGPTDADIAQMDWAELKTALDQCTRCGSCKGASKPVHGTGARRATWLVAAGASTMADEQAQRPVAGEPGILLDNMLAAAGHALETDVYVSNLIKCRPVSANGGDRAPNAEQVAACRPYLERELVLTGAGLVLTLGQIAANALQDKALATPLAGSRGQVHALGEVPLVATLHPGELLRRGADKALAWADLCLAKTHDGRPG